MTEEFIDQQTELVPPEEDRQQERRRRTLQRTYLLAALFLIISTILDLAGYFEAREWQLIGDAAGTFVGLILLAFSYARFRRGDGEGAAFMIPFVILVTYAPDELFLDGAMIYNLVSGVLLHVVAFFIFKPQNRTHWLRQGLIFVFSVIVIGNIQFFPKLDITGDPVGPIITSVIIILLIWQIASNIEIRSFQTRVVLLLLAVGAIPALLGTTVTTLIDRQQDITQTGDFLTAVSDLKSQQIDNWIDTIHQDLQTMAGSQGFIEDVEDILREDITPTFRQRVEEDLFIATDTLKRNTRRYYDFVVIDLDGQVIVTTNPDLDGDVMGSDSFLETGSSEVTFTPINVVQGETEPVYDARIYYPVLNANDEVIGTVVGYINPSSLFDSIVDPSQLGETGQAYLINTSLQLLTPLRNSPDIPPGSTEAGNDLIEDVLVNRGALVQEAVDYTGEDVIGSYSWHPALQSLLVVEQSRFEANSDLRLNVLINALIGILAFGVTLAAALTTSRNLSAPIQTLSESAMEVRQGNLQRIEPLDRTDEIGDLSQTLSEMTGQLYETTINLETTVTERTAVLERRAKYLETTAQISRAVTAIYDINALLNTIAQLIHENFGFYHVGIFILDERGEFAVLRASNSEGGWKMLARDHKLEVGAQGIVGYVTGTGESRIQQQVTGEDSVYFDNPDLPHTRSEMALPLKIGEEVFGALDVQSTEEQAFSDEDVAVLQVLADSVSVAIQNTRLVTQLQETLETERRLFGDLTKETWSAMLNRDQSGLSIRSDSRGTEMISSPTSEIGQKAMSDQTAIFGGLDEKRKAFPAALPVKVRGGVTIGVVETQKAAKDGPWTQEERNILETVSAELGLALDNARLFQETQRRAQRDRIATDLSTKIWASSDVENILQTAIQELGSALQVSRGTIRLSLPEDETATPVTDGANQS